MKNQLPLNPNPAFDFSDFELESLADANQNPDELNDFTYKYFSSLLIEMPHFNMMNRYANNFSVNPLAYEKDKADNINPLSQDNAGNLSPTKELVSLDSDTLSHQQVYIDFPHNVTNQARPQKIEKKQSSAGSTSKLLVALSNNEISNPTTENNDQNPPTPFMKAKVDVVAKRRVRSRNRNAIKNEVDKKVLIDQGAPKRRRNKARPEDENQFVMRLK